MSEAPSPEKKAARGAPAWLVGLLLSALFLLAAGGGALCWYRAEVFRWGYARENTVALRAGLLADRFVSDKTGKMESIHLWDYFFLSVSAGKEKAHRFFLENNEWSLSELHRNFQMAVIEDRPAIAKDLIGAGVDPNGFGELAWHAMRKNQREMVKVLVEGGLKAKRDVLEIAARNADAELVELMLAHGADPAEAVAHLQRSQKTPQSARASEFLRGYLP